ncbi:hypothetical protein GHT06_019788 [Daphnia sinensis]|uniref:Uncharacterized protein n=1 Tax=Daphnia sinensis TaxID=1820382 RepID=A0AAD5L1H4_9CRUS|nr:hypothetical protein GHT06_019788 [Daphnia sinensis]
MDGHQVTLVMVESQTSHNTSVKKKIRMCIEWEPSAKQFRRRRNRFFQTVFFYITCDLFQCNCRILKVDRKWQKKKTERLFLHLCALLA